MARTGQDLLNQMEMLFPEAQLQPGEVGVTQGLLALNAAQYYFESLLANEAEAMGDGTGNIVTATNTETTAYPTGVLRIDRLQMLDSVTLKPVYDLDPIRRTGGHVSSGMWPYGVVLSTQQGSGRPGAYYTNARLIYWAPQPDAIYTIRWYGLQAASDITASGTFAYDDRAMLPMATFAVRLVRTGLDDPVENYMALAQDIFTPTIKMMSNFKREEAAGYNYRYNHST